MSKCDTLALVNDDTEYSYREWVSVAAGVLKNIYTSVDVSPLVLAPAKNSVIKPAISIIPATSSDSQIDLSKSRAAISKRNSWIGIPESWSESDTTSSSSHDARGNKEITIGFAGALWSTIIRDQQEKAKRTTSSSHVLSPSIPEDCEDYFGASFGPSISPTNTRSSHSGTNNNSISCKSSLSSINENSLHFQRHQPLLKPEPKPSMPELRDPFTGSGRLNNLFPNKNSSSTLSLPTAMSVPSSMGRQESNNIEARFLYINEFPASSASPHCFSTYTTALNDCTIFPSSTPEIFSLNNSVDLPTPSQEIPTIPIREEELPLHGAPWGKEGLLDLQVILDNSDKKSKQTGSASLPTGYSLIKNGWTRIFVVVQQGYLRIFRFDKTDTKSSHSLSTFSPKVKRHTFSHLWRRRSMDKTSLSSLSSSNSKSGKKTSERGVKQVGGGNWTENATMMDSIPLCHCVAQIIHTSKDDGDLLGILPHGTLGGKVKKGNSSGIAGGPSNSTSNLNLNRTSSNASASTTRNGSSAASPNSNNKCNEAKKWALLLPNNDILLFNAGTREIAEEFVYSCNYWAARVSKEPLLEAVSSNEFGWGKPISMILGQTSQRKGSSSVESSLSRSSTASSFALDSLSHKKSLSSFSFVSRHNTDRGSLSSATSIYSSASSNGPSYLAQSTDHSDLNLQFHKHILGTTHEMLTSLGLSEAANTIYNTQAPTTPVASDFISPSKQEKEEAARQPRESQAGGAATAAFTRFLVTRSTQLTQHPSFHKPQVQEKLKLLSSYTTPGSLVAIYNGIRFKMTSPASDILMIGREKISMTRWREPLASTIMSQLDEQAQINALSKYFKTVEDAYHEHIATGAFIGATYKNRASLPVMALVFGNWEDKFSYILKEIMKYDIYTTTLEMATEDKRTLEIKNS